MKNLTKKSINAILAVSVIASLLLACSPNPKPAKESEHIASVQAPEVDIHTAVLYGNVKAVEQHIEAGTDLNGKELMGGSTPLISAITFNHSEIAKALVKAGADLEIQNNDGSSALHVAAFFCRVEMVKMLVDANADQTKKNNYGSTALEIVSGPFQDIKPVYELMQAQLGPLGLNLNLDTLEKKRPVVAEILK